MLEQHANGQRRSRHPVRKTGRLNFRWCEPTAARTTSQSMFAGLPTDPRRHTRAAARSGARAGTTDFPILFARSRASPRSPSPSRGTGRARRFAGKRGPSSSGWRGKNRSHSRPSRVGACPHRTATRPLRRHRACAERGCSANNRLGGVSPGAGSRRPRCVRQEEPAAHLGAATVPAFLERDRLLGREPGNHERVADDHLTLQPDDPARGSPLVGRSRTPAPPARPLPRSRSTSPAPSRGTCPVPRRA